MKTPEAEAKEIILEYRDIDFYPITENAARKCAIVHVKGILKLKKQFLNDLEYFNHWEEVLNFLEKMNKFNLLKNGTTK